MPRFKQSHLFKIFSLCAFLFAAPAIAQDADGDGISDVDEGEFNGQTLLNNASIEQPAGGGIVDASLVPFWDTTASDNKIEVWVSGALGIPSFDGNQHVELNAFERASLYQDVATPPGYTLQWSVAHRGRQAVESATVSMGAPGSALAVQTTMTTGTAAWKVYSGSYAIPAGQTTTRISFDSLTEGGSSNHIDKLTITIVSRDTDGDGTPDYLDLDSDNDGIPDAVEGTGDSNGDGIDDRLQKDDKDGDGIGDALDLDDDNDGILDTAECSALINTNASFESPVHGSGTPTPVQQFTYASTYNESDVPGWDTTATDNVIELGKPGNQPAHDGNQYAEINANLNAQLYQDVATTPGSTLSWSIWHRGRSGEDTARILIGASGGSLVEFRRIKTGTTWQRYSGKYVVPAGQTTTRFGFESVATSTGNTESGNFIDLFEVSACPDFNNDGTPNSQDIDTDDDGIPDNVEAQLTTGYIAPSGTGAAMTDTNNDGVDDNYDGSTPAGTAAGFTGLGLTPVGSDSDSINDVLDLDSDNDTFSDVLESGIVDQGTGTLDTDKDGLLDRFEGSNANDGFDVNDEINVPSTNLRNGTGDTSEVAYREVPIRPTVTSQSSNDSTPVITGTHDSGTTLSVTVNSVTYTEGDGKLIDNGNGTWTLNVPTAIPDGVHEVVATSTHPTGTISDTSTNELIIDATPPAPTITVNEVTTDNILNAMEAGSPVTVTGTVAGDFSAGDVVTLSVNGTNYTAPVDAAGLYSIDVPGSALLADTVVAGSVSSQDTFGNVGTATTSRSYTVDATPPVPTLSINPIAADDVLNASEASAAVSVTGTAGGDFNAGDTVTLSVAGNTYTGTVNAAGQYSIDVPGSVLSGGAQVTATINSVDAAGNTGSANSARSYSVDVVAPVPTIALNTIAGDDQINSAESSAPVAISGTVGGDFQAGDTVTVSVDGQNFTGAVDASGNFAVSVPGAAIAAGSTVSASVATTDAAGNPGSASSSRPYSVDTTVPTPTITVAAVTPDNVINAAEAGGDIAVTGSVGQDFQAGDTVTLSVNGKNFTGTVNAAGEYSIPVPGADLVADSSVSASVATTDAAGNPGSASVVHSHTADTQAPAIQIAVDAVTPDNTINAAEASASIAVTGKVSGEFSVGDTVTLNVDGTSFAGTVDAAGVWSINVPGSTLAQASSLSASVATSDAPGNAASATSNHSFAVDTTPPALTVSVNAVTNDNVVNAAEAGMPVSITGSVGGDYTAGDSVSLVVNGKTFTGTVDGSGNYAIDVPGADLAADANVQASVTSSDNAGNATTVTANQAYTVNTTAPVAVISINAITADNVLNAAEASADVSLGGVVKGDFNAGDTLVVSVNGKDYPTVVDATGAWTVAVPGSDLSAATSVSARLDTVDSAGNSASATNVLNYTVDTVAAAPVIALDVITPDNILNAAEAAVTIAVTGKVSGEFNAGDLVTVSVNGKDFIVPVDATGAYSASVPGSDLAADPTVDASIRSIDGAGNPGSASTSGQHTVDTGNPVLEIAVSVVTDDNAINAAEANVSVPVTGAVRGDFKAGDTVTLNVNGKAFTGPVDAQGRYVIDIPGSDLAADNNIAASVTSIDSAGNSGSASATHAYTVDTASPKLAIAVDSLTADNVINNAEGMAPVAVTGSVTGDFIPGDTVTVQVNGKSYIGPVDVSGAFSIDVPGAELSADTSVDVSLSSTDAAGNSTTESTTHLHTVDTSTPMLSIAVDPVTNDNVLNAAESGSPVSVTGKVKGDFVAGDVVSLMVNGKSFSGPVDANGVYAIAVDGSDLAASDSISASVQSVNGAGNSATVSTDLSYKVDASAPVIGVTVAALTPDNILNAAEAAVTLAVTGKVSGEFMQGDTVSLEVNGKQFTGSVKADGSYSVSVPGTDLALDSSVDVSVSTKDAAGNPGSAVATQTYTVDTLNPVLEIAVSVITNDNAINAAEAGVDIAVTGAVRGEFSAGDVVTLMVNGKSFTGTLDANGNYSVAVPGADLAAAASIEASVVSIDQAGNTGTAKATHAYLTDTTAPELQIAISTISDDNVLNAIEVAAPVKVSGKVTGDFVAGDLVTLSVDGNRYTTPVDALGKYQLDVPGSVLAAALLVSAEITSSDAAGNMTSAKAEQPYTVDTLAPALTIALDPLSVKTVVADKAKINGQVSGDFKQGDEVSLMIDGVSYTGPVDAQGRFSIEVPAKTLSADTEIQASITTVDSAGNMTSASANSPYSAATDADADGIPDVIEGAGDSDNDGIPNWLDLDSDNDGLPDALEAGSNPTTLRDTDGDGVPDVFDLDSDNDGISDLVETQGVQADRNNDGKVDDMRDTNNDGLDDALALLPVVPGNVDGDSQPDYLDTDTDNDGLADVLEAGFTDADGDGIVDSMLDSDNDGIVDSVDWDIQGGNDSDGDGIIDEADIDNVSNAVDTDNDGIIDARDPDADGDGRADLFEDVGAVVLPDTDNNGVADVVESATPTVAAASPGEQVHTGLHGGGCSIVPNAGRGSEPLFGLLLAFAGLGLLRRKRKTALAISVLAASLMAAGSAMASDADLPKGDEGSITNVAYRSVDNELEPAFNRRFYAGFGLGRSWLEPDTTEVAGLNPNNRVHLGGQVTLGYDISKLLSLELHAAELGDAGLSNGDTIAYRQGGASALLYAGKNNHRMRRVGLSVFGRAGLGYLGNKRNGDVDYKKDHTGHLLLGLGAELAHRSGLALRGETIVFDADSNYTQLSLLYRFGRRNQEQAVLIADAIEEESVVVAPVTAVAVAPIADEDADGVANPIDECAATPAGLAVDSVGCALLSGVIQGVNFHTGSAELTDESVDILSGVATTLNRLSTVQVRVSAHTDSVGTDQSNLELSQRRAESVAQFLTEKGVEPERLDVHAYGEKRPIADNETASGRLKNRRVELDAMRVQ